MKISMYIFLFWAITTACYAQDSKAFLSIYDKYWEIEKGYYRVSQDGEIGLIDANGNIIIPCENDQVWNLQDNGNIKVLKDGKLGIYNLNGDIVVPAIYDMIWDFEGGKAKVMRNSMIGYVNETGNEFIPCKYQQIWDFEDGKARVLRNGKFGIVDETGSEIIPAKYQKIWDFEDGKALVLRDGKMGMIDESGNEIITPAYQKIWNFEFGTAKVLKNGKMGYINDKGEETIPCIYDHLGDWENNKVKAIQGSNIFYLDRQGQVVEGDNDLALDQPQDTVIISYKNTVIDKDGNVKSTKVRHIGLLGTNMVITKDKNGSEISFDNDPFDKWEDKDEDDENDRNAFRCHGRKNRRKFQGHYFGVDLGFNNYLNSDYEMSLPDDYDFLSLNSAKSVEVSVNLLQQDIHLGSTVGFYTGLGFNFNNYRFDQPILPIKDENGNLSYQTFDNDVRKSKLTAVYMTVPVMFELQFSKRQSDAFYMALGGVGGYRIASHTKVVTSEDGKKVKDKNNGDFTLNSFRYGAQIRFGFKAINLYGTYYFSSLFDTDKAPELNPVSIGFSMYPDWW